MELGSGDTISVGVIKRQPHLHLRVCKVPHADAACGAVPIGVRQTSAQLMPNGRVQFAPTKLHGGLTVPAPAMRHLGLAEAGEVIIVLSDGQEHLSTMTCQVNGAASIKYQWRPIMDALRLQPGQNINMHAEERSGSKRLHIINATDPRPPAILAAASQMVSLKSQAALLITYHLTAGLIPPHGLCCSSFPIKPHFLLSIMLPLRPFADLAVLCRCILAWHFQ